MTKPLPPELDRLGDQIARATARKVGERRRRNELLARIGASGVAAALALAMLAPAGLTPSDGGAPLLASSGAGYRPVACDQPRGATFAAARPCATPGATDVTPDLLARRYAVH